MRKVIKIQEIAQISKNIDRYIADLKEEREIISMNIEKLTDKGTTDNFKKIVGNLKKRLTKLDSIIETLEFYNNYIDEIMNAYDSKFLYYKNKLSVCVDDFKK